jgi:uncharacterized membrane protein YhiD involved in acid resistance
VAAQQPEAFPLAQPSLAAVEDVLHPEALLRPLLSMVVAAALGAVMAFRPRRPGGPPRTAHVVQTQIMLSIVGSLVMLVIGASLARAFGIAGAASLVRYRAKIDDPKDASVMLACLAIGLASGVGLFLLASVGTAFIVAVLWGLEWREPWPKKPFELKVSAKDPTALKPGLELLLKQHRLAFEMRGTTDKEVVYFVEVPQNRRTDKLSEAISRLDSEAVSVEWSEKKPK